DNDFVLLQIDVIGNITRGRIIHVDKVDNPLHPESFNGNISIASLNRKSVTQSPIENGYITAFHPAAALRAEVDGDPEILPGIPVLPEVIVVGYIHTGGVSFSDWYYL